MNTQEKDFEIAEGIYTAEFWEYDSRTARRWNIDPMGYPWQSHYSTFNGNPIKYADPSGLKGEGWVEGKDGNVTWDKNTNSEADFKTNYTDKGKTGFKYVSDKDNANSYTLPSGEGKLILNEFDITKKIEDGLGGGPIKLTFEPTNKDAQVGWTQTFSTNQPNVNSGNLFEVLPDKDNVNRLDGAGSVQYTDDVSQARYFDGWNENGTPNKTLSDHPNRSFPEGSKYPTNFKAESSVLTGGKRVATVSWGFTITSGTRQRVYNPTILKKPSEFHIKAVSSLIQKTSTQ